MCLWMGYLSLLPNELLYRHFSLYLVILVEHYDEWNRYKQLKLPFQWRDQKVCKKIYKNTNY